MDITKQEKYFVQQHKDEKGKIFYFLVSESGHKEEMESYHTFCMPIPYWIPYGGVPDPGKELYRPCKTNCCHPDCNFAKYVANRKCLSCREKIGYNKGFYQSNNYFQLEHQLCAWGRIGSFGDSFYKTIVAADWSNLSFKFRTKIGYEKEDQYLTKIEASTGVSVLKSLLKKSTSHKPISFGYIGHLLYEANWATSYPEPLLRILTSKERIDTLEELLQFFDNLPQLDCINNPNQMVESFKEIVRNDLESLEFGLKIGDFK